MDLTLLQWPIAVDVCLAVCQLQILMWPMQARGSIKMGVTIISVHSHVYLT